MENLDQYINFIINIILPETIILAPIVILFIISHKTITADKIGIVSGAFCKTYLDDFNAKNVNYRILQPGSSTFVFPFINKYSELSMWTQMLIVMLILLIETGPIVVKLLSPRGYYDAKLDHIIYINSIILDRQRMQFLMDKNGFYIPDGLINLEEIANEAIKSLQQDIDNEKVTKFRKSFS